MNAHRVAGLVALLLACGCAKPRQVVVLPDLSRRIENPRMARIYVIRPSIYVGQVPTGVFDDDRKIGTTGAQSYLCWERRPGLMELRMSGVNSSRREFEVKAGEVYYFLQHVEPAVGTWFKPISEEEAREHLKQCRPAMAMSIPRMSK